MGRGDPTPSRLEALKAALHAGKSVSAAAKAAGYARTYVYAIARVDPEVEAILEVRRQLGISKGGPKRDCAGAPPGMPPTALPAAGGPQGRGDAAHQAVAAEAVALLRKIMADDKAPKGAQVTAARTALNWAASEAALLYRDEHAIAQPAQAPALDKRRIAFVFTPDQQIVEFLEAPTHSAED